MAKDIVFAAGFVASGVGATGLTVTVDVRRVTIADLTNSEIVTGGSATELGDGMYAYRYASADLQTYMYYAIFKTSGTADVKHLFAVWTDFADSSSIPQLVWDKLTSALSTASSIGKLLVDNINATISSRLASASYSAPLSSAQTASAVLDATASSYNTSGTIGAKINSAASNLGAGASSYTATINNSSNQPVDGAEVWVTTDLAGANVVASGTTNSAGQIVFTLDTGSYYLWAQRAGINFSNPTSITVS